MKNWILALLLLLSFSASANSFFPLTLYDLNGQCGSNVQIELGNLGGSTPALTNIFGTREIIIMDANFVMTASPSAVWFVFFHECGHRTYHHSPTFNPPDAEDVADCYAARRFVNTFGYAKLEPTLEELEPMTGKTRAHQILECVD